MYKWCRVVKIIRTREFPILTVLVTMVSKYHYICIVDHNFFEKLIQFIFCF